MRRPLSKFINFFLTITISVLFFSFAASKAEAAIQYVGGTSGSGTGATYSVSLTSLSGGIGTAPQVGDLVIVVTGWASGADGNPGVTTTGYTEVSDLYANGTRDANVSVNYKFMGSTADTSVTVSGFNNAANGGATVVQVWRGVNLTTPLDVTSATATGTGAAQPNSPSITPTTSGAVVISAGIGTGSTSPTTMTAPTGYGNSISKTGSGTSMSAVANIASKSWTSGAEDPAAWTGGGSSASDSWGAVTLALRPRTDGTPYGGTNKTIPGTIQAEDYNLGGEGVGYHDSDSANSGGKYRTTEYVDIENTTDASGGTYDVGWTAAGEWMNYTVDVQSTGTYSLQSRTAGTGAGSFLVQIDNTNVTTVSVPATGGWQTWQTVTTSGISLTAGTHVLRIYLVTAGYNLNYFTFVANQSPTANAGTDQSITLPTTTTTLNGSGTDSDGTIASYAWSFISGPATPSITSATSASTGITGLSLSGTYVFRLTVTDNSGATGTDDINVVVSPDPSLTIYYVDFGLSTTQTSTTGWNNLSDTTTSGPTLTLVDSTGATTSSTLHITDSFYYSSSLGMDPSMNHNGTSSSTVYPSTATGDSFFLGTLSGVTDNSAQVTIGGLSNSNTYDFRFYASRVAGDSGNRTTDYTIGATTVSLNATDNVDSSVQITGVSPTSGSIVINVAKNASASFGYLGVLEISEHAAANQSPTANAGTDQSITLPTTTTTLNGSGTDSDGTIASYAWSFISGPATPSITSASSASTGITGMSSAGTYVFRLTVTDNLGATGTDDINVVVNASNVSPTANAGLDQSVTMPVSSVTLSGSGNDTDGTIASYAWSEVSTNYATITSPTAASTTVTDLASGTYTFRLTVTDNLGATGTDDIVVTVADHNLTSPTAKTIVVLGSSTSAGYGISPSSDAYVNRFATYFDSLATGNSVVNLAVSGYTTYHILPTGSSTANRPSPDTAHNITQALTYNPAAILVNMPSNDTANNYSTAEQETNFQALKSAADSAGVPIWFTTTQPRNNFTQAQVDEQTAVRDWILSTYGSNAINFWNTFATASGTIDPTYDQGDGIHLNNMGHKKLYARVAESTMIDTVYNGTPTANAGTDQSITLPTTTTTLNGSGTDSDGIIASYAWSFISGPATPSITSASSASTGITGMSSAGTYTFRLTVTDNIGSTDTDDINVVVNAAGATISYLIDFGRSTSQTSTTGWNNFTDPRVNTATALIDSSGSTTSTTLQITDAFYYSSSPDYSTNVNGTTSSTVYPSTATSDSFFLGTLNSVTDTAATVAIGGLTDANTYDFRFYGSRVAGDGGNRTGDYTIGATTVTLNATDNVNNYVDITGVSPTSGTITINITKDAAATYAYLGVLEITEHQAVASTQCVSQGTGNWNTAGTWGCGHVPSIGDDVTIASGHTVTIDTNPNTLNTITINGTLNTDGYDLSGASVSIAATGTLNTNNVWGYYKTITIDHTKVPNSDLTDFPVVINGTYADLKTTANGGHVTNSIGYDIAFFSDSSLTTKLKWEIETYSATTGQLVAWVKIPTLSHTADTVIYMAYGNAGITTDQSDKTNVWDSNYLSVWHLDEAITGNGQTLANSTSYTEDLTTHSSSTYSGAQVSSPVGYGISNVKTTGDYLSFPQISLSSAWTIEGWAYFEAAPDQYTALFSNGSTGSGSIYNTNWYAGQYRVWDGSTDTIVATTSISSGSWHHFVVTRSGTALAAYVDGNASGTSTSGKNAVFQYLAMDGNGNPGNSIRFDEVRISSTQRSADWIKTQYNNENSPSTFYTVSSETSTTWPTSTISVSGDWTNAGTFNGTNTTIKMTDNSANPTFAGGGATYSTLWFAPGAGTGTYIVSGDNTFDELKDDGTAAHTIEFTAGSTQTVTTWNISGTSGNLITLTSTTTGTYNLTKPIGAAETKADYLSIEHSVADPYNSWYAGENSTNRQNLASAGSGWIFSTKTKHHGGGSVRNAGGESDNGTGAGTCSDGIQNGDETGVDTGGRCANTGGGTGGGTGTAGGETTNGTGTGTCSDGIQNGDETGIDQGGRCANTGGGSSGGGGDVGFLFFFQQFTLPTMSMWFAFR